MKTQTIVAFDTSTFQLIFEAFLIPAAMITTCVVVCFLICLAVMMWRGYFPVVAMVSKKDSDLVDALIEVQTKLRGER